MKWHAQKLESIFEKLEASKQGLSKEEAARRLAENGPNVIDVSERSTVWQMIVAQFINPLIIILIGACVVSFIQRDIFDAGAILVVVILNTVLGVIQEYKAEGAIEALRKMTAPKAKVMRDGNVFEVNAVDLVQGDIAIIASGDLVPADLRLTETIALACNEAILTGESKPAKKDYRAVVDENATYGDWFNTAFMGSTVATGRGVGVVVGTGINSAMGKVASSLASVKKEKTTLEKQLASLGLILGIIFLFVSALVFIIGVIQNSGDWSHQLLFAVSLAVAAIPEGLPAVVTIVLSIGTTRMSKEGAIIRKLSSVETLGATTVICTDKTGTLTENRMKAEKAVIDNKTIDLHREQPASLGPMAKIAAGCNDATYNSDGAFTGDPTEIALLQFAMGLGIDSHNIPPRVDEISFDSARKAMTTVHSEHGKTFAYTKGAFEVVLGMSNKMLVDGKTIEIDERTRIELDTKGSALTKEGYRVMGFAYKHAPIAEPEDRVEEKDLTLVGFIALKDPIRFDVPDAVASCKRAGIKTVMVTGDHPETAMIYAKKLGIASEGDKPVTGVDFVTKGDSIVDIIPHTSVFARVAPEHKLKIVETLQKEGHIVAMTGDGVNDAPALKKANIGVSMGITGCEVAKDAASLILTDDSFATIAKAVYEGRVIFDNIKKFIWYMLGANIGEVFLIFLALITGNQAPLAAIQLLWINLLTDSLPALALGVEPAEKGIMDRPPRNPKTKLLSGSFLIDIVFRGIVMGTVVFLAYLVGESSGDHTLGMTFAFSTCVVAELVLAYACRSFTKTMLEMNPLTNLQLIGAIAISFVAFLLTFLFPQVFKTTTIGLKDIGIIVGLGIIPAVTVDVWKLMKRIAKR